MLQITPVGGFVQIVWPAFDPTFHLESSADLSDPNAWVVVADSPVTNGDQLLILEPITITNQFYRLKKP